MAEVVLEHVTKVFPGNVTAVDAVDLAVRDREFVVLVGPSGCGKSTTLRMIAGLEDITAGTIRIGPRIVNTIAPKDRDIAMVFQNYALYPHMSVYRNMAFGLMLRRPAAFWDNPLGALLNRAAYKRARAERAAIDARVRGAAATLGLQDLLHRRPRELSGGQRQRVAVGRALVRQPQAYLLDEPLSNLDAKLRVEMRAELKRLHRTVNTTTIYVTHDQEEAMTLGERVVVMHRGRIQQADTPFGVYDQPKNRFVAGFVGTPPMNFLEGRIAAAAGGLWFESGPVRLAVAPRLHARLAPWTGKAVTAGIRPENLALANGEPPAGAGLPLEVQVVEPLGDRVDVHGVLPGGTRVVARLTGRPALNAGTRVGMQVELDRVHFFEPDGAQRNLSLD
jgi:multiple sugar transport system ATP-binding protein